MHYGIQTVSILNLMYGKDNVIHKSWHIFLVWYISAWTGYLARKRFYSSVFIQQACASSAFSFDESREVEGGIDDTCYHSFIQFQLCVQLYLQLYVWLYPGQGHGGCVYYSDHDAEIHQSITGHHAHIPRSNFRAVNPPTSILLGGWTKRTSLELWGGNPIRFATM